MRRQRPLPFKAVVAFTVGMLVLATAPTALAGGPQSPFLVTTAQVTQSGSSGDPIQVDTGTWLHLRPAFIVTDTFVANLDTISMQIEFDGQALDVEYTTEELGEVCADTTVCANATALYASAFLRPLKPGDVHTITYRFLASGPGVDGFGFSWEAGDLFETTGTLVAARD